MTAYHGGKQRIGKQIADIIYETTQEIEENYDFSIKGYCEPFCGMLGVYQHIPQLFEAHKPKLKYKAGDVNKSVVMMWKAAQKGWKPPTKKFSKADFEKLKYDGKYSAIKGFVGHVYTYRGIFFDGYFPHKISKIKHNSENVATIASNLKNVAFHPGTYDQYSNLKNYIIYCDPPYSDTEQRYYTGKEYKNRLEFNHKKFWDWCKQMSKDNIVFVSEYKAPKNTVKIWSKGKEKLYLLY